MISGGKFIKTSRLVTKLLVTKLLAKSISSFHSRALRAKNFREKREADLKAICFGLPEQMQSWSRSELVAGAGFEPTTSGLWARRATWLLYPAINALTRELYYSIKLKRVCQPFLAPPQNFFQITPAAPQKANFTVGLSNMWDSLKIKLME